MKRLRKMFILIMVITMAIISTNSFNINILACSTLSTNYKNTVNVGVLFANLENPFWQLIDKGLKDIENKTGNEVRFTSYDGKNNIATQYEQIDSLIRSKVDLLIIRLANSKEDSIQSVIDKVIPEEIPVIFLNVDPLVASKFSKYYANRVVFAAEDFKQPAALQGKIIIDAWNADKQNIDKNGDDKLQYVMLSGERDNPVAEARTQYSISAINDAGIKTQQLEQGFAKWDREITKQLINQLILKYNDRIEAILANSDSMAIGAVEALQAYGYNKGDKSKNILVVGFDGLQEAKDLIDKGMMTGTITQEPNTVSEALYTIGMNLINNRDPLENTDYKLSEAGIVLEFPHYEYINKSYIS